MRVLLIASTFPQFKGDQTPDFVWQLARHLAKLDCRVTVLAPSFRGARTQESWEGVHVVRFRYATQGLEQLAYGSGMLANIRNKPLLLLLLPSYLLSMALVIRKICREQSIEVVNAHWFFPQGWVVAILKKFKLLRLPVLTSVHGSDAHVSTIFPFKYISRWLDKSVDCHLHVGHGTKALFEVHRLGLGRSFIRPMGLHACYLTGGPIAVRKLNYDFVYAGRLVDQKGVDLLLLAFNDLIRNVDPNLKLAIAGVGVCNETLRTSVVELKLSSSVDFLGWLPESELVKLYRESRTAVFPSRTEEGYGLAIAEALVSGCSVVTSGFPSVKENFPFPACRIFSPRDWRSLSAVMLSCLHQDEIEFGMDTKRLRYYLSWNTVAKEYIQFFKGF